MTFLPLYVCNAEQKLITGFIDFPPYAAVTERSVEGIVVDNVTSALVKAGISYEFVSYPPKRMFSYFKTGKVDMIILTEGRLGEFKDVALFSNEPFMKIYVKLYAKRNTSIPLDLKNITGVIGIINGYHYDNLIEKDGIEIHTVVSHDLLFKMLKLDRLNYVIDYFSPSETAIKANSLPPLNSRTIKEINLYFSIRKEIPKAKYLIEKIVRHYER